MRVACFIIAAATIPAAPVNSIQLQAQTQTMMQSIMGATPELQQDSLELAQAISKVE